MSGKKVTATVLLVDDEAEIIESVKRLLRRFDLNILSFTQVIEAEKALDNTSIDIVISDQRMPGKTGIEFLSVVKQKWPKSRRILLSAYQDFGEVADAFNKKIVHKYISKPWQNEEFKFVISRILARLAEQPSIDKVSSRSKETVFHGIATQNKVMRSVFADIQQAATSNAPIFIHGETGTGKELVAKACHAESFHHDQPFIAVNCANFNESLMEAQLFGHVKGAFTGAQNAQQGVFAAAGSGVLFLDEITTLDLALQAKLLRVIQEREFIPLGSVKSQPFEAQIVSASSTSLADAVKNGEFREDLFYRLFVIGIDLPPLRDRKGDAALLASRFLKKYLKQHNQSDKSLSQSALDKLSSYKWPGNVRQLENLMQSVSIMHKGSAVNGEDIEKLLHNFEAAQPTLSMDVKPDNPVMSSEIQPLWQTEKEAIESAIASCNGNVVLAASLLEISPSTIYRKMQNWT